MSLAIYDARVWKNAPGKLARPEPLGRSSLCVNLGIAARVRDAMDVGTPLPEVFTETVGAFQKHTELEINTGSTYVVPTPAATPALVEIDLEGWEPPNLATDPSVMKSITSALKLLGVRMTCCPPDPLGITIDGTRFGMQDDAFLKQPTWVPDQSRLAEMRAWRKLHLPWMNDLYAQTFCVYFDPIAEHDETWFNYLNNCLLAIRAVYGANQRIFCHTWAHRNTGLDNPPALPDATIQRWAGALLQASDRADTNLSGVIVWNADDKCGVDGTKKLLMSLGVEGVV